MTDILEELNDWLKIVRGYPEDTSFAVDEALIQRARDEIAKLRESRLGEWGTTLIAKARAEALEEAASAASAAIRGLKEKGSRPLHKPTADRQTEVDSR